MSVSQSLRWIALPYTAEGKRPRLSAFLSLRLMAGNPSATHITLGDYDGLADFGERLARASWAVEVNGRTIGAARLQDVALEAGLWGQVFGTGAPVAPWQPELQAGHPIWSFAAAEAEQQIVGFYRDLALSDSRSGRDTVFQGLVDALGTQLGVPAEIDIPASGRYESVARGKAASGQSRDPNDNPAYEYPDPPPPDLRGEAIDKLDPAGLYGSDASVLLAQPGPRRPGWMALADAFRFHHRPEAEPAPGVIAPGPPVPTFDVHRMLAALGDQPHFLRRLGAVVDLELEHDLPDGGGVLRIVPQFLAADRLAGIMMPGPLTKYQKAGVRFLPVDGPDVIDGQLALEGAGFAIVQTDVDGAALKLTGTASTAQAIQIGKPAGLIGTDVKQDHAVPALRSAGLNVVQSHRAAAVETALQRNDQLHLAPVSALQLDGGDLRRGLRIDVLHDGVWRSLHDRSTAESVAGGPPEPDDPGLRANPESFSSGEGYVKTVSMSSAVGSPDRYLHEAVARWSGWSLSAPRPGRVIRPEVSVDRTQQTEHVVAQDPAQRADYPADGDTDTYFKRRFSSRVTPGSLPRLRFGETYRLRARIVDLAGNSPRPEDVGDEHATPPVTYRRWEPLLAPDVVARNRFGPGASLHRMAIRSVIGTSAADYDTHNPPDQRGIDGRHVVPPAAAVSLVETHGELDPPRTPEESYALAARESVKLRGEDFVHVEYTGDEVSGTSEPGAVWLYPGERVPAAHLTDPINRGVWVWGLPGASGYAEPLRWCAPSEPWTEAQAWRIDLIEGAAGYSVDGHVLTVSLPAAATRRLWLSAILDEDDAPLLGVFDAIGDGLGSADARNRALAGQERLLTPPRSIVLVHAVQRPLDIARFGSGVAVTRQLRDSHAVIAAEVTLDRPSTGHLDLHASWDAQVDEPGGQPHNQHTRAHVANVRVPATGPASMPLEDIRHQFGDTRHRRISYWLDATTRFGEYFDPKAWQVTPDLKAGETHSILRTHVPASAPPAAPRPRYVVPTFTWRRTGLTGSGWSDGHSTRSGGGLRVWHERGWWSSGDDELLACVLADRRSPHPLPAHLRTLYGRDPLTHTESPAYPELTRKDFRTGSGEEPLSVWNRPLLELPSAWCSTVGFAPEYDAERDLFHFDLRLQGRADETYAPFVRLALARLQPWALPGAELSTVVLVPPVQLLPNRSLRAKWQDDETVDLVVTGIAPGGDRRHVVSAWVERRREGIPGDLGWEIVPESRVVLRDGVDVKALRALGVDPASTTFDLAKRVLRQPQFDHLGLELAPKVADGFHVIADPGQLSAFGDLTQTPLFLLPGYREWSGRLTLPASRFSEPFRVVVVEQEHLTLDIPPGELTLESPEVPVVGQRVVYLDILDC